LVILGNIALILIKFEVAFKLICQCIKVISIILDGANYLLLEITPSVSQVSYMDSIALLCLIICFILVKKGFYKYKYAPVFILIMLIIQGYRLFPKIDFINLGFDEGIIISYKYERVFIGNIKENKAKELGLTKVIPDINSGVNIRLGKNYSIKVLPSAKRQNSSPNLDIRAYNSKTIITRNSEDFMDIDLSEYDIIKLPERTYYPNNNTINTCSVIYNKVYDFSAVRN
jgi:competence protein ComEC